MGVLGVVKLLMTSWQGGGGAVQCGVVALMGGVAQLLLLLKMALLLLSSLLFIASKYPHDILLLLDLSTQSLVSTAGLLSPGVLSTS
jgi:hypothetical protein